MMVELRLLYTQQRVGLGFVFVDLRMDGWMDGVLFSHDSLGICDLGWSKLLPPLSKLNETGAARSATLNTA